MSFSHFLNRNKRIGIQKHDLHTILHNSAQTIIKNRHTILHGQLKNTQTYTSCLLKMKQKRNKHHSDRTGLFRVQKIKLFKRIGDMERFILSRMPDGRYLLNRNVSDSVALFNSVPRTKPKVNFLYVEKTSLPERVRQFYNMKIERAQAQNKDICELYRCTSVKSTQCCTVSIEALLDGDLNHIKNDCFLFVRHRNRRAIFKVV